MSADTTFDLLQTVAGAGITSSAVVLAAIKYALPAVLGQVVRENTHNRFSELEEQIERKADERDIHRDIQGLQATLTKQTELLNRTREELARLTGMMGRRPTYERDD